MYSEFHSQQNKKPELPIFFLKLVDKINFYFKNVNDVKNFAFLQVMREKRLYSPRLFC